MRKNQDLFYPNHFYHVYNRTNNREKLFTKPENYVYFLKKYDKYLSSVLTTYSYCLLGNHFHLLVKIKEKEELVSFQKEKVFDSHQIVSKQFATFLGTYSKAFNKQEKRTGNLFQRPFKRVKISSDSKFANIIYYLHANPELHKITSDFRTYKWSSYQAFLSSMPTKIPRAEVLDWFGGKEYFLRFHQEAHDDRTSSWYLEE